MDFLLLFHMYFIDRVHILLPGGYFTLNGRAYVFVLIKSLIIIIIALKIHCGSGLKCLAAHELLWFLMNSHIAFNHAIHCSFSFIFARKRKNNWRMLFGDLWKLIWFLFIILIINFLFYFSSLYKRITDWMFIVFFFFVSNVFRLFHFGISYLSQWNSWRSNHKYGFG